MGVYWCIMARSPQLGANFITGSFFGEGSLLKWTTEKSWYLILTSLLEDLAVLSCIYWKDSLQLLDRGSGPVFCSPFVLCLEQYTIGRPSILFILHVQFPGITEMVFPNPHSHGRERLAFWIADWRRRSRSHSFFVKC